MKLGDLITDIKETPDEWICSLDADKIIQAFVQTHILNQQLNAKLGVEKSNS